VPNPSGDLRLIFTRPDGGVSVDAPIEQIAQSGAELAQHIARLEATGLVWKQTISTGLGHLPSERTGESRKLRNCWRWNGAQVEADIALAKAQIKAEVRTERNKRLAESDADKIRLDDIGTTQQKLDISTYRQTLRDLPASTDIQIDNLISVPALELYNPTWPIKPK